MLSQDQWLLPEGIEDVFPEESERLETLGRRIFDLFASWGYRLVSPPLIDFVDSLQVGTGRALDLNTFKLTDPLSGRLIGIRADMTPQVARIDARTARAGVPSRLCYKGAVLKTHSGHLDPSRNPLQLGAELYGSGAPGASLEVMRLMLEMFKTAEISPVYIDLGHVAIYRELAKMAGLMEEQEARLFDILQRKDPTDLRGFLSEEAVDRRIGEMIVALLDLNGPRQILTEARAALQSAGLVVLSAVQELELFESNLRALYPDLPVHFDLAELRGYEYHTGIVFAAFVPGQGREIARGGRYDEIGRVFGQARPAIGFSADLKQLARLGSTVATVRDNSIYAPFNLDSNARAQIRSLRANGRVVVEALSGDCPGPRALGCGQELQLQSDKSWKVMDLERG